jgi:hypothetical protein
LGDRFKGAWGPDATLGLGAIDPAWVAGGFVGIPENTVNFFDCFSDLRDESIVTLAKP